ncbi:hypothetical protein EDL98_05725 [Ornithobacterium rhinotracheale]|uniref:hypothetical protein n=1 Tax=Ornithobacterium rhinotracheale TaxID=28251 RepID=UPI00129CF6DF|nr:hypothetical protein [Ornithobacterium rhinotracheale]MRJ10581.1 hypothetical protein [Ornithobacterium rhinotracheale]
MKKIVILLIFLFAPLLLLAQKNDSKSIFWQLNKDGAVQNLQFGQDSILFRQGEFRGPMWYVNEGENDILIHNQTTQKNQTKAQYKNIDLALFFSQDQNRFCITAQVTNHGTYSFSPEKLGLRLGIDTYMEKFPDWEQKFFPTLLRCEKNYFWGYFLSPKNKLLSIVSPNAIASWSHVYNKSWGEPPYVFNGHRIHAVNLDFINQLPLPARHPQDLNIIKPGETKKFQIYLNLLNDLSQLKDEVIAVAKAPFVDLKFTTIEENTPFNFEIFSSEKPKVIVSTPKGKTLEIKPIKNSQNRYFFQFRKTKDVGNYTIKAFSRDKTSEAIFSVRQPYSFYMNHAMKAVLDYPQKASTTHCEAWYGFYTSFLGGKIIQNPYLQPADQVFQQMKPMILDTIKWEPKKHKDRIQNASTMIGILVARYQLFNDEKDLNAAIKLANFLMTKQSADGAYRSGKTHYTSVIYIAKA